MSIESSSISLNQNVTVSLVMRLFDPVSNHKHTLVNEHFTTSWIDGPTVCIGDVLR